MSGDHLDQRGTHTYSLHTFSMAYISYIFGIHIHFAPSPGSLPPLLIHVVATISVRGEQSPHPHVGFTHRVPMNNIFICPSWPNGELARAQISWAVWRRLVIAQGRQPTSLHSEGASLALPPVSIERGCSESGGCDRVQAQVLQVSCRLITARGREMVLSIAQISSILCSDHSLYSNYGPICMQWEIDFSALFLTNTIFDCILSLCRVIRRLTRRVTQTLLLLLENPQPHPAPLPCSNSSLII